MPVYFDPNKKRWRFTFNRKIGNARHRATKLLPKGWSRTQAEQYDRVHGGSLYAQAAGIEKPRLPLSGAVQLYLDKRVPKLGTGKKIAQDLAHLVDDIERHYLDEVADLAHDYEEAHPELAPATIHNRLAYLKSAVRFAYKKEKYGDRDHTDRMVLPEVHNGRQVYAKPAELERLWAAFTDPEARAIYRLAYYLGPRWRANLLRLPPEAVERNGRDVWLNLGKTKNGTQRMQWVHPKARPDLKYLPFTHSDSYYYDRFHEAREAIKRPDLRPHDLRHSLASRIRSEGGSLADVGDVLGHISTVSAKRYSHLYPERQKELLRGIGGRENAHRAKKTKPKVAKKAA